MKEKVICPLCGNGNGKFFCNDKTRDYFRCKVCDLIFVSAEYYLSSEIEKSRYDLHENDPSDLRYRDFLRKMFEPIKEKMNLKLEAGGQILKAEDNICGLDFGCGPGPTLSVMFEEAGFNMSIYDKFYFNDLNVFKKKYDFITATEVFEHLKDPHFEIKRLIGCLKKDGVLGIMTKFTDGVDFENWHYKNDDTHICFYSKKTFEWVAKEFGLSVEFIGDSVVLFGK